jgi:hypothetical protein
MAPIPPTFIAMKKTKREVTTLKGTGEYTTITDTLEQVDLTLEEGVNMMTVGLDTGRNITMVGALKE